MKIKTKIKEYLKKQILKLKEFSTKAFKLLVSFVGHFVIYLTIIMTIAAVFDYCIYKYILFSLKLGHQLTHVEIYPLAEITVPRIKKEKSQEIKYEKILDSLGVMGQEIKLAAKEFSTSTQSEIRLRGLLIGIANAESTLGKNFHIEYDKKCHNWWGIKGGNMKNRKDGSSLRCFVDEKAGARTAASLLTRIYIGQGLTKPETIVKKYVGSKWSIYHDTWIKNVYKFYENI